MTTPEPVYSSPTFRTYPPETLQGPNGPARMQLCETLTGGRWEPFITFVSRPPQLGQEATP